MYISAIHAKKFDALASHVGIIQSLIDQNWHKYVLIFFNIYDNQIENYSKVKINDSFFSQLSLNNWTIKFDSVLFGLVGLIENNFPSVRASHQLRFWHTPQSKGRTIDFPTGRKLLGPPTEGGQ